MSDNKTQATLLPGTGLQSRSTDATSGPLPGLIPSKIQPRHLERLAMVYVRQSTVHQVLENGESRDRQYALTDHAMRLGWTRDRVVLIDEDQGQSGQHAEDRRGFQRLLAEVTLDHVGLILALEMSRLARSDKDWHHVLELCAVFGTLLADQDGIYDPADPNDRLLLGLKGTMSSLELHTMHNRLEKGKLSRAQRGELFMHMPIGYVKSPSGQVSLDPDEQVRSVVALIFDKFEELGSCMAVFRYLLRHGILLGVRPHYGPNRGELEWRRPSVGTLYSMLRHPYYGGTYAYGRHPTDLKRRHMGRSKRGQRTVPMDQWLVVQHDQIPAYITWQRYLDNQDRLRRNRSAFDSRGASRKGAALLGGLLFCAACGTRMQVLYKSAPQPRYDCGRHKRFGMERTCHSVSGPALDALVAQQVLLALQPAALELSLRAADDVERERARLAVNWKQQLERARFDVLQAERRYRAVDAENRLVARTLERQWEQALQNEQRLGEEYDRFRQQLPPQLTPQEKERIASLSGDVSALWGAAGTSVADRKDVIRCLIERVEAHVQSTSEMIDVTLRWAGGFVSRHQLRRSIAGYRELRDFDHLVGRLRELRLAGLAAAQIAERLNEEGFHPIHAGRPFDKVMIRRLLSRWELSRGRNEEASLGADEWWLSDLARRLKTPASRLRGWLRRGWVHCRRSPLRDYCIVWADAEELKRLEKLCAHADARPYAPYPVELTAPKHHPASRRKRKPQGQARDRFGRWQREEGGS